MPRGHADGWSVDPSDFGHVCVWEWHAYAGPRVAFGQAATEAGARTAAQEALARLKDTNTQDAATQAWLFQQGSDVQS